jgi:hypothetical protein
MINKLFNYIGILFDFGKHFEVGMCSMYLISMEFIIGQK